MNKKMYGITGLILSLVCSGCAVRTYTLTKDRVDQDLSSGNRGYLQRQAPCEPEKERKTTRSTRVVEIEMRSPVNIIKTYEGRKKEAAKPTKIEPAKTIEPSPSYLEEAPLVLPRMETIEKYTVEKNDTLQKISLKFYGTTKKWQKIYEANKDILKGPNKVYPGQVLNIPIVSTKEKLK
jgi:nucleoid-associated protein YgaU